MQCVTAVLCYLEYPANAMVTSEIEYWVTEEVFVLTHARNIRFLSGVPPFWEFRFEFHFSIKFHHLTLYSTSHFPSRELKMAHELEEGDFTVEVILIISRFPCCTLQYLSLNRHLGHSRTITYPRITIVQLSHHCHHCLKTRAENFDRRESRKPSLDAFSQSRTVSSIEPSISSVDDIFLKWFLFCFFAKKVVSKVKNTHFWKFKSPRLSPPYLRTIRQKYP